MVQFCYIILYLGTEIVSRRLLLRLAGMDVDCNEKILGQLFQDLMPWLQKSPKILLWVVLFNKNYFDIFVITPEEHFV